MVVVKGCYTITPAEPTPAGSLLLSDCDQSKVWSLSPTIYAYPPNASFSFSQVVDTLTLSLSQALVPFHVLAASLRWIGGGRLEILCNAAGVAFVVAESELTLEEFGDCDPTDKIKPLLPRIDYDLPIEKLPAMSVQVTGFACGGLTIGLAISHIVFDGASAMHFIKSWTKLARREALDESDVPFHDRSLLVSTSTSSPRQHVDTPVEWKPLPLLIGRSDVREEQEKETTVAMLRLTKEKVEEIKKKTNLGFGVSCTERPYSRFESISAHIWRSACKARRHEHEQRTVLMVGVDIRKRVKPPLPDGYIGNAVVRAITDPECVSGELATKPPSYAAEKVREAACKVTDKYIKSTLEFIKSQEDVSWLRSSFHTKGSKKGQYLGNPNIFVTSWMGMRIHDADFGWGRPAYMGPGTLASDGKCFIIPSCVEDGSLIVALCLRTDHMGAFENLFYHDI